MTNITILDGSIGQELVNRSADNPDGLWSTRVLMDYPDLVREVHDDYFKAGAEIVTTNTYTLHRDRLRRFELESEFEKLNQAACEIAVSARDKHGSGRVASSLGPTGGSYQPDIAPPAEEAAQIFAELANLHAPYADLFILETMSSLDQSKGGLMGATSIGKPVWIAVSVEDDDGTVLRSGEPVVEILPLLKQFPVEALLVNCSTPEAVSTAIPLLTGHGIPVGAYANGFTRIEEAFKKPGASVDVLEERQDLDAAGYADFAAQWVADGASLIGGCCCVGPAHIAELHNRFK